MASYQKLTEAVLVDGSADMVAIGRQSIADPHFAVKALEQREDDIVPCISCGQGCIMHMFTDEPISCVINPGNTCEETYLANKAEHVKRVLVIGGSPGGLQAAWILAARGHQVDLMEKDGQLGGWILAASYPPGKAPVGRSIAFWERQCKKYGVRVHLNTEVTMELIRERAPDAMIVATGSTNLLPQIPGLNSAEVLDPCDVLYGKKVTGHRVLVCGGGLIGVETADFLSSLCMIPGSLIAGAILGKIKFKTMALISMGGIALFGVIPFFSQALLVVYICRGIVGFCNRVGGFKGASCAGGTSRGKICPEYCCRWENACVCSCNSRYVCGNLLCVLPCTLKYVLGLCL